jgi:hypothetical protein
MLALDLDLATNSMGDHLSFDARQRLQDAYDRPSEENWDRAFSINLTGGDGPLITLWMAVCEIDPTFPKSGPRWSGNVRISGWPAFPSAETIAQAVAWATH